MGKNSSETDSTSTQHNGEAAGRYLTFWTDNQLFGIPIASVEQIVKMQEITSIPEFPDYAKGIIDLRGNIIPIIDVRLRLHKQEIAYNDRTCIIVTNIQQNLIGLIVDAVDEVTKLDKEKISAPPKVSTDSTNEYLTGIAKSDEKIILLLNSDKILQDDELAEIVQENV